MKLRKNWRKRIARLLVMVMILTCVPMYNHQEARAAEQGIKPYQSSLSNKAAPVSATNSFGKLFQESVNEQIQTQEDNSGYNVFSVEMQDKTAIVSIETIEDCTLVVGIYEEDGIKMFATGEKEVAREEREVTLDIEIDTMPQYYLVRAFLVETDTLSPLCSVYETPMYTKEMQDFLSKTTDDFEEERVLNLDEDKTNNFAVYDDDTKIIRGDDNSNHLICTDEEKQTYVIENADTSATSLSKEDIFAYEQENEEVVIIKVQSVSVTGSTVTINGADTELEDVFEYVKIDETATTEDMEVDSSTCSEQVEYQGKESNSDGRKRAISGEGSTSVSLSYKFVEKNFPTGTDDVKVKLSGEVKLSIKTTLKVYISLQYQYLEYTSKYSLANDWKGEVKTAITLKLGIVIINPVPGLYIEVTPSFLLEGKTSVSIKGTIDGCTGYSASPQDGFKDLTSGPSLDDEKTELKIEGSVFVGLSLEPGITVVTKKLVKASAKAKAGLELTISNDYWETLDDAKEKHDCKNCFEGELYAKGEISASLKFFDNESFEVSGKKEKKFKISDVYLCIQHGKFAFSSCPYHQYKVTVIAKNPDGTLVKDATVNQNFQTNSKGEAHLWFAQGKHKLSVSKNGEEQIIKVIDVAGKARKITVTFKTNSKVEDGIGGNGDVGNIGLESNPLAGKKIKSISLNRDNCGILTMNGELYSWGMGDDGQLGTDDSYHSIPVKILSNVKEVQMLDCGPGSALLNNGDLYMWGMLDNSNLGANIDYTSTPTKVLGNVETFKMAGFYQQMCYALTKSKELYVWGTSSMALGETPDNTQPFKVMEDVIYADIEEVADIDFSTGLVCAAIKSNGELYMWGRNTTGILGEVKMDKYGDPIDTSSRTPKKIMENVRNVKISSNCCAALTNDGNLYTWGKNSSGQLGNGNEISTHIPQKILSNIVEYDFSDSIAGAIDSDGNLFMWGGQDDELFTNNGFSTENILSPHKIMSKTKKIYLDNCIGAVISQDNKLFTWGYDFENEEYGKILSPQYLFDNVIDCEIYATTLGIITNENDLYMCGNDMSFTSGYYYDPKVLKKPTQINIHPAIKMLSKKQGEAVKNATNIPTIATWTGRATGWGGPDSYPFSANHEQGTAEVTYDSNRTNIKNSVGYGCGLELMNPDNSFFNGEENELTQILNTMKKPCIRVTLENGGIAHGWNRDEQVEFPSGKNILFPKEYFDTQYFAIFGDDDTITSVQIYDASLLTLSSDGSILPVQSFEDLDANATYNYYFLKSKDTLDTLSSSNLLYIGQGVSDSSGILCTSYEMKEAFSNPTILLHKLEKDSVADAKITLSNLSYNKQEQYINPAVTYQGKSLVEGRDYELSGDFSASEIGTYTVTICGIGNYTGFVDKTYDIYCSHQFGNWTTTIRPTYNNKGTKRRICSLCQYEEKKAVPQLQDTQNQTEIDVPVTTPKKPGKVTGLIVKNKKKRKVTVSWNWKTNMSGFQIQYAQNKKFTKKKKSKFVDKWTSQKTISKLKKNKTYYIRVRAYKKSSGKKIYGKWSKVKKVKIRK